MILSRVLGIAFAALAMASFTAGCSRSENTKQPTASNQPIATQVEIKTVASPSAAALRLQALKRQHQAHDLKSVAGQRLAGQITPADAAPAISGEVTLVKAEIFNRVFLYGSDLQYSTLNEGGMLTQTIALGHEPAFFRIHGDRLQLAADQSHYFESNINHPERLIHQFPILRQDETTVTIAIREASPTLVTVLAGASAAPARASWVRSLEFVPQGNYLLFESSVEQADGTVAEFMESLFPRDTLVPAGAKPLLDDAAREPLAVRYRFLSNMPVYLDLPDGRHQTLIANRFVPPAGKLIEWWITPNVPAEYLHLIQTGVEGWNRYSQKMWGRDFVKFRGVLPAGVKIGDPRYNVISWDSVLDAGAAYESQAADPLTGVQSHSLIYLPYAWIEFGEEFWRDGGITQNENAKEALRRFFTKGTYMGRPLNIRCFHDASEAVSLEARRSPEAFGRELLKQVLLHEVGHALGLAHNFKGSLAFNPDDSNSFFSSSIMDYNQYQVEDGMYESEQSANGPLLEYDRQIISVLYNEGRDVAATDPELPACNDAETDQRDGGVDPLCIRYDAGNDPTAQLVRSIQLVKDPAATLGKTKSLAASIQESLFILGDATQVTTDDEGQKHLDLLSAQLQGVLAYYYASGAQSIRSMVRLNARSLYVFAPGVLPASVNEGPLRERVAQSISQISQWSKLEPSTIDALAQVEVAAQAWLHATPWYQGLAGEQKSRLTARVSTIVASVTQLAEQQYLAILRSATLASLVYDQQVPFYFSMSSTPASDYELMSIQLLENALTQPLDGKMRPFTEREATAKTLATFAVISEGQMSLGRVALSLSTEISKAQTAKSRDDLRKLLKIVQGK